MKQLLESADFQLEVDNEAPYHVARNTIHLRRLRGESQASVALAMGTSQPKVARIESGDGNITLGTLMRVAKALGGRIRLSIEPKELNIPQLPPWWEFVATGIDFDQGWRRSFTVCADDPDRVVAAWSTEKRSSEKVSTNVTQSVACTAGSSIGW